MADKPSDHTISIDSLFNDIPPPRERGSYKVVAVLGVLLVSGLVIFRPRHWHLGRRDYGSLGSAVARDGYLINDEVTARIIIILSLCKHQLNFFFFKWAPDYTPFNGDFRVDASWPCQSVVFGEDSNTTSLSFKIPTGGNMIRLWSRGPLLGNVTFEPGGTSGDEIEVDLKFMKPDWYPDDDCDRSPHGQCSGETRVCSIQTYGANHHLGIFVSVLQSQSTILF